VIVRFVDIYIIVDNFWLNFLFIMTSNLKFKEPRKNEITKKRKNEKTKKRNFKYKANILILLLD